MIQDGWSTHERSLLDSMSLSQSLLLCSSDKQTELESVFLEMPAMHGQVSSELV